MHNDNNRPAYTMKYLLSSPGSLSSHDIIILATEFAGSDSDIVKKLIHMHTGSINNFKQCAFCNILCECKNITGCSISPSVLVIKLLDRPDVTIEL